MQSPLQTTRDEYRAYDSLPPELRKFLREFEPEEISARKVYGRYIRNDYDDELTLMQLRAWARNKWPLYS